MMEPLDVVDGRRPCPRCHAPMDLVSEEGWTCPSCELGDVTQVIAKWRLRQLVAKWRDRAQALCRRADGHEHGEHVTAQHAKSLADRAECYDRCADELDTELGS